MTDLFTFSPIILLIIGLFLLAGREIKRSLEQSRTATKLLTHDRNALQAQLDKSTEALQESELARRNELARAAEFGRLAQGIFHDLITPLTSIILHTEQLKNDPMTHKHLEKTVEAGNRMARYIQDIRATLSREESERVCYLHEELDNVLHLFAHRVKEVGIEITVNSVPTDAWHGNPIKLRQLFSNLVSNAIDSFENKTGKKNIEIVIKQSSTETVIEIRDTGSGISPENMKKIFDPFFTTKSFDKGTGIGLATVKSIVENDMRGTIEVVSTEGKGTTVRIRYTDPVASPPLPHTPLRHE